MKFIFSATTLVLSLALTAQAEDCSYTPDSGSKLYGTCMTPTACANINRWWVANQCSGGSNNRCCLPQRTCSGGRVAGVCLRTDGPGTSRCSAQFGEFVAGYCPGPDEVKCCNWR